jgi:hypothetical protein
MPANAKWELWIESGTLELETVSAEVIAEHLYLTRANGEIVSITLLRSSERLSGRTPSCVRDLASELTSDGAIRANHARRATRHQLMTARDADLPQLAQLRE